MSVSGGTRRATRGSSSSGSPIQKSMPSGPATSSRRNCPALSPRDAPDQLADQPTVRPHVVAVLRPGLPQRRLLARVASTIASHASTSSSVKSPSTSGSPAWWLRSLPHRDRVLARSRANSGQYVATGASGSSRPRSISEVRAHRGDALGRREHAARSCPRPRAGRSSRRRHHPTGRPRVGRRRTRTPRRRPRRARRSWPRTRRGQARTRLRPSRRRSLTRSRFTRSCSRRCQGSRQTAVRLLGVTIFPEQSS